jgi:hypothetical protein
MSALCEEEWIIFTRSPLLLDLIALSTKREKSVDYGRMSGDGYCAGDNPQGYRLLACVRVRAKASSFITCSPHRIKRN